MLVEGDAIWTVDDGECPQVQKHVPESIQKGAVMIWASRAEQSAFWSQTIGRFDPPAKRQKTYAGSIEVFYGNVTQWNRDVRDWLLQQNIQIAMLVETHVTGKMLEVAAQERARSRWRLEKLDAYETGRGGTSGGQFSVPEKDKQPIGFTNSTRRAMASLPMSFRGKTGKWSSCRCTSSVGNI